MGLLQKVKSVNLCALWNIMELEVHIFFTFWTHLWNKGSLPDIVALHKRLSLSCKHWDNIIITTIWCILLPQRSISHDLCTIGSNGKKSVGAITLRPTVYIEFHEKMRSWIPCKLVIPSCFISWKNSFSDIDRKWNFTKYD